ncbi:MAG: T9SS type A sorting domain-containing protein [Bacteroidota bacterium]
MNVVYTLKTRFAFVLATFLFSTFYLQPLHAQTDDCEGVPFAVNLDLVRGVCESGELAILDISVVDGTNPGEEFFYDFEDGSHFDIMSGGTVRIYNLRGNTQFCVTVLRQETENCRQTACIDIPAVTILDCHLVVDTPVGCDGNNGGVISASVSGAQGAVTYQWSSTATACSEGAPTDVSTASGSSISNLTPGKYLLTITDGTGCSSNRKFCEIEICRPAALTGELEGTQPDCPGNASNGTLTAFPSGGTGAFTYAWTGPNGFTASTATIDNLLPGSYVLELSDESGCVLTLTETLVDPDCTPDPPVEEEEEEEEAVCDCEQAADGTNLFEVEVSTTSGGGKKGKKGNGGGSVVKTARHKIRFLGSAYDPVSNTTTFSYKVSDCGDPDISHFAFGSNGNRYLSCFTPSQVSSENEGWKKRDNAGISGIKYEVFNWEQGLCNGDQMSTEISFTMSGEVGTTSNGFFFGIKAGNGNNQVAVPGPDCDDIQSGNGNRVMQDTNDSNSQQGQYAQHSNAQKEQDNNTALTSPTETNINTGQVRSSVYPNPFNDHVNVLLDKFGESQITMEVLNATGSVLQRKQIGQQDQMTIDLSGQPQGMYLIRLIGNDHITSHKVLKR